MTTDTLRQARAPFRASTASAHAIEPALDPLYRRPPMASIPTTSSNSGGWITFTYIQFAAAAGMAALGVVFLPVDLQTKGFLLMSYVFTVGATFTLAKTVRDEHETKKLTTRIEDARTERLLMDVGRG